MRFLSRSILALAAVATVSANTPATAEIGIGADLVSRYIWRGTDFGNAVSVQPGIAYATDAFEIGAWSSWAINGGGANENDLYATVYLGPVGLTITDYFFPAAAPANFFSYGDGDAVHILEASASADVGPASLMAAFNFSGDAEDSFYLEAMLPLAALSTDDVEVGLGLSLGNGVYTTDTDPALVTISLNVSAGDYFAQYILNPDAEITFLVFGTSF